MTKRTVTNGSDRTIVTKGTGDYAVAIEPDELLVLKKKRVIKFNNFVKSDKLELGTSAATTIGGESIWIQRGWLGPPSEPTHGPGYMGTKNGGLVADGEAEALTASTNVKAEGHPVVRVKDKTWQNRRNTKGEVMTEVVLMDLSGDGGDESGGAARARGSRGGSKKPPGGRPQAGKALLPPSPDTPIDECTVLEVAMACQHGRRDRGGFLQVVTPMREQMRIEGRVDGRCRREHPAWTVPRGELRWGAPAPGVISSVFVVAPGHKPLGLTETLDKRDKNPYTIRCEGCRSPQHDLTLEVFEPGRAEYKVIDGNDWWIYGAVVVVASTAEFLGADKLEAEQDKTVPVIDGLKGKLLGSRQVVEHVDHRVYVQTLLEMHFDPFLRLAFKVDILSIIQDYAFGKVTGLVLKNVPAPAAAGGARIVRRSRKVEWIGEQIDKLKKKVSNLKDEAIDQIKELEDRAFDVGDRIGEMLGGTPDAGRRERARQMLHDHWRKMGQMAADASPIQFPKMVMEGMINLHVAIDATYQSALPDAPAATVSGSGLTGSLEFELKASSKQRVGILVFRVPCELSVTLEGKANVARPMYVSGLSVGVEPGSTPWRATLQVTINCGGRNLVSPEPHPFNGDLKTGRVELFPTVALR